MTLSRRQVLCAAPAGLACSAAAALTYDDSRAFAARRWLIIRELFDRLQEPHSRWTIDDLLHEVITFNDLNRATDGEVMGKAKTIERLRQLQETGDLTLNRSPTEDNVTVTDDWSVFATARPPYPGNTIAAAFDRAIAFGFQISEPMLATERRTFSIITVMRPFERSWHAATECSLRNIK